MSSYRKMKLYFELTDGTTLDCTGRLSVQDKGYKILDGENIRYNRNKIPFRTNGETTIFIQFNLVKFYLETNLDPEEETDNV
jgi:hypothetical protein